MLASLAGRSSACWAGPVRRAISRTSISARTLPPTTLTSINRDKRLNLFPWLVAAYQAQHAKGLVAIARPHHQVLVGENVDFDGSNSLVWGGGKIVQCRWVFPDGETIRQAKARKQFDRPGAYVAALWIKDDKGGEDVDFCQVKVYSRQDARAGHAAHLHDLHADAERPPQPAGDVPLLVSREDGGGPINVDFDDGTQVADYRSYTELQHAFKTPGVHVVTAQCDAAGKPIMQKLKVVVESDGKK